jgi:hypothetical protein
LLERLCKSSQSPFVVKRLVPIAIGIGVLSALVILYTWNPATTREYPRCPFRALTGCYCSGCGSTRAVHQLLHGHIGNAFRLNPLVVLCLPLVGYALLCSKWRRLRFRWLERLTATSTWPWVVFVVILLFGALRNLPFEPFCWLAPH